MGQDKKTKPAGAGRAPGKGDDAKDREMGSALRTVYQKTVDEKIPDDLLDLLGKLN